jgi:hypothetical protein
MQRFPIKNTLESVESDRKTIAPLSDIHSNVPALRVVLREVEDCMVDEIVFCGDMVGYGPHSAGPSILRNSQPPTSEKPACPRFPPADSSSVDSGTAD